MKAYICDACGTTITNPYETKMKEFCVGTTFDGGIAFPINITSRVKIHICHNCFKGLENVVLNKYNLSKEPTKRRETFTNT